MSPAAPGLVLDPPEPPVDEPPVDDGWVEGVPAIVPTLVPAAPLTGAPPTGPVLESLGATLEDSDCA